MTAIEKEADEVINLMRRSKMDDIRAYLIKIMKGRDQDSPNLKAKKFSKRRKGGGLP